MTSAQPEPTDILSKAASVENIMTWLLAQATCKGPREFGWFTRYAADRIPVDVKINMLGDVVDSSQRSRFTQGCKRTCGRSTTFVAGWLTPSRFLWMATATRCT